jgi:hypothetical protein
LSAFPVAPARELVGIDPADELAEEERVATRDRMQPPCEGGRCGFAENAGNVRLDLFEAQAAKREP